MKQTLVMTPERPANPDEPLRFHSKKLAEEYIKQYNKVHGKGKAYIVDLVTVKPNLHSLLGL